MKKQLVEFSAKRLRIELDQICDLPNGIRAFVAEIAALLSFTKRARFIPTNSPHLFSVRATLSGT